MPSESKKPNLPPIHSLERENFKMAWMRDFREMLRSNPGIIKTAIELANKATEEYNPASFRLGDEGIELEYDKEKSQWLVEKYTQEKDASGQLRQVPSRKVVMNFGRKTILAPDKAVTDEKTGLNVTMLGRSNRELQSWFDTRIDKCDYFKITFKDKKFFVKRSFISNNPGFTEFSNTISAKEALKDYDFVKVVEAQLGYQDQNESWYISNWEDLEEAGFATFEPSISFTDYGKLKDRPSVETEGFYRGFESKEKYDIAERKSTIIRRKLKSIGLDYDLRANLFFNHKTGTFILLDVTGDGAKNVLGEPIETV